MPSPWQKWKAVNNLRRDFFLAVVEEDRRERLLSIRGFIYQSTYLVNCQTMSRFGAKGRKLPGAEFSWDIDPSGEPEGGAALLYPVRLIDITQSS